MSTFPAVRVNLAWIPDLRSFRQLLVAECAHFHICQEFAEDARGFNDSMVYPFSPRVYSVRLARMKPPKNSAHSPFLRPSSRVRSSLPSTFLLCAPCLVVITDVFLGLPAYTLNDPYVKFYGRAQRKFQRPSSGRLLPLTFC